MSRNPLRTNPTSHMPSHTVLGTVGEAHGGDVVLKEGRGVVEKGPGGDRGVEMENDGPNPKPGRPFKGTGELVELPGGRVGRWVPADDAGEFSLRVVEGGTTIEQQAVLDGLATLWEETGMRREGVTVWANPAGGGKGQGGSDLPLRSRPLRTWNALLRTLPLPMRLACLAFVVDGEVRPALLRGLPTVVRYLGR